MTLPQQSPAGLPKAKQALFAAACVAAVMLPALPLRAADYHVPPPLPDDALRGSQTVVNAPPNYANWSGFYFGGVLGRSFASANFASGSSQQISDILANTELAGPVSSWTILGPSSTASTAFGGFRGYNIQWGEVVTGAELSYNHAALNLGATGTAGPIDIPGANLPDGSTVLYHVTTNASESISIHDVATVRMRFGWVVDRLLPYAFVGMSLGRADVTRAASVSPLTKTVTPSTGGAGVTGAVTLPRNPESDSTSMLAYGIAGGLGVDVGITPNLFLRTEWEYAQFTNIKGTTVSVNSVHAGVGFKF